jgi:tetratricopeptide (TPR) repeat protein
VIALAIYSPVLRGELILDDWGYITQNPWITETSSPWLFWTRLDQIDYYPLTYTWYWVAWRLFGENTLPYHLVNVALHAGVASLIASLSRRLFGSAPTWVGALAGLAFLLHPQNVPAVTWIVQSKTLLATFLALAASLLYLYGRNIMAVGCFTLALAAKASVVSLPVWLFLVGRRERRPIRPLLMMVGVSCLSAGLATYVNRHAVANVKPLAERIIDIPGNLLFYLRGFLVPTHTAFVHELRPLDLSLGSSALATIFIVVICASIYRQRHKQPAPYPAGLNLGVSLYLIGLLPAIGLVPSQYMRVTAVADHYAYFANAGMVIALSFVPPLRWLLLPLMIWWASLASNYAKDFATEEGIWRETAKRTTKSAFVWYNLGTVLDKKSKLKDATLAYEQAISNDPNHILAHYNLAGVATKLGDHPKAEKELREVITLSPRYAPGHANLAHAVFMQGRPDEAITIAQNGVNMTDPDADLWIYLCRLEAQRQNFKAAKAACDEALKITPGHATAEELRARLNRY